MYGPLEVPRSLQTLSNALICMTECYWMLWEAYDCLEWPSGCVCQLVVVGVVVGVVVVVVVCLLCLLLLCGVCVCVYVVCLLCLLSLC